MSWAVICNDLDQGEQHVAGPFIDEHAAQVWAAEDAEHKAKDYPPGSFDPCDDNCLQLYDQDEGPDDRSMVYEWLVVAMIAP